MSNSSSPHDYFAAYPNFIPDPNLPLLENFNRLANAQGWRKKRRHEEQQIYLLGQYAIHLGEISTGKLQKWQNLCRELRVDPIPTSITKCKKVRYGTKGGESLVLIASFFLIPKRCESPHPKILLYRRYLLVLNSVKEKKLTASFDK